MKNKNNIKNKRINLKKKVDENAKDVKGSKVVKMLDNTKHIKSVDQEPIEKNVCVVGFISSGQFHNDGVKNPIEDEWMSESGKIPQELLDDMRKNGWTDADGNICFREDYQPLPVKGADGNVYLAMNDTTMNTPAGMGYMMDAHALLVTGSSRHRKEFSITS
jgi:hypothetical protein